MNAPFKLTYSTMFDPPAELHGWFEEALVNVRTYAGTEHPMMIGGPRRARAAPVRAGEPDRHAPGARALPGGRRDACACRGGRREGRVPAVERASVDGACGDPAARRGAPRGARLRARRRARAGGRQEPHGIARRGAGDGGPDRVLLRPDGGQRRVRGADGARSAAGLRLREHERAQAARGVAGHRAVQLPARARRRAGRRGARRRQHRRVQGGHGHAVERPPASRSRCATRASRPAW